MHSVFEHMETDKNLQIFSLTTKAQFHSSCKYLLECSVEEYEVLGSSCWDLIENSFGFILEWSGSKKINSRFTLPHLYFGY